MSSPVLPKINTAQLLISVTSVGEAKVALENGADIIDLKEPSQGALGALPLEVIQSIVDYVKIAPYQNRLTSATIGDLPMQPLVLLNAVQKLIKTHVDIIKIGFFESEDYATCLEALMGTTQQGVKLIAVLFAEKNYPKDLISQIKHAGFYGVMLDTANKNGQTLFNYYTANQCIEFAEQVLNCQLKLGLAGSLKLQHVENIKPLNPTYIGFRGGVCSDNQRHLALDESKIRAIRKTM